MNWIFIQLLFLMLKLIQIRPARPPPSWLLYSFFLEEWLLFSHDFKLRRKFQEQYKELLCIFQTDSSGLHVAPFALSSLSLSVHTTLFRTIWEWVGDVCINPSSEFPKCKASLLLNHQTVDWHWEIWHGCHSLASLQSHLTLVFPASFCWCKKHLNL